MISCVTLKEVFQNQSIKRNTKVLNKPRMLKDTQVRTSMILEATMILEMKEGLLEGLCSKFLANSKNCYRAVVPT